MCWIRADAEMRSEVPDPDDSEVPNPNDSVPPTSPCSSDPPVTDEQFAAQFAHSLRGVPLLTVSALLLVLRTRLPFLPKDGRTLMKTPRKSELEVEEEGSYFHHDIRQTLRSYGHFR